MQPAAPKREAKYETRYLLRGEFGRLTQLDGAELILAGNDGKRRRFRVGMLPKALVGIQRQHTTYFDTDTLELAAADHMLRARGRLTGNGKVKGIELEAQLAGAHSRERVSGGTFKQDGWEEGQAEILAGRSKDPAVRAVQDDVLEGRPLLPVAEKEKTRTLLFAHPVGLLPAPLQRLRKPELVIALDEVKAHGRVGAQRQTSGREVEVQIFTKLPWQKKVRDAQDERIALYRSLCAHLEREHGLVPDQRSAYAATIEDTVRPR